MDSASSMCYDNDSGNTAGWLHAMSPYALSGTVFQGFLVKQFVAYVQCR